MKLAAFKKGVDDGKHTNSWMLCVRGASDVKLSSIIKRLEKSGLSKPFEIVWTCCRAPINQMPKKTYYYEGASVLTRSSESEGPTKPPGSRHNKFEDVADGILTIIHQKEIHRVGNEWSLKAQDRLTSIGSDKIQRYSPLEIFGDPRKSGSEQFGDQAFGI